MKSVKGIVRDCTKVLNILNVLTDELGAYSIQTGWKHDKGLQVACEMGKLVQFANKNNLEIVKEGCYNKVKLDNGIELFIYVG